MLINTNSLFHISAVYLKCSKLLNAYFQTRQLLSWTVVSSSDSQYAATGLYATGLYMLGAHQACYPFGIDKLVPASAEVNEFVP